MRKHPTPQQLLEQYLKAKRHVTDAFVEGLGIERIGPLPESVRIVLTYMLDIEAAVWGRYYAAVDDTPTGKNPVVARFLKQWAEEEGRHAALLDRILTASGGETPRTILAAREVTWIAKLMGERLFGGIHMAIGAANELMAGYAYRQLARISDNATLRKALLAIAAEESIHYSFYYGMARYYLSKSRLGRLVTLLVMNLACTGVGIGVRSESDAHEIVRLVFRGDDAGFSRVVGNPIRKLPGLSSFRRLERMFAEANA